MAGHGGPRRTHGNDAGDPAGGEKRAGRARRGPARLLTAKGKVTAFGTKSFSYSSENLLLTGALKRRYVHRPAVDEPILWCEGSGTTDRRFLSADERGSIIAISDSSGNMLTILCDQQFGQQVFGANLRYARAPASH